MNSKQYHLRDQPPPRGWRAEVEILSQYLRAKCRKFRAVRGGETRNVGSLFDFRTAFLLYLKP